jgi:hypothetical protein
VGVESVGSAAQARGDADTDRRGGAVSDAVDELGALAVPVESDAREGVSWMHWRFSLRVRVGFR